MNQVNEVIIKENKKKVIPYIILGSIMLIASIFVIFIGVIESKIVNIIIGIIGTILFGMCFIFIVKTTFKSNAILIIGENGITDMSTLCSVGFISWEEIKSVYITKRFSVKFIAVEVHEVNKLINRIALWKQVAMKLNLMIKYPPVTIVLNTADMEYNEVLSLIQKKVRL